MAKAKVGIYGGTFNPPHVGHVKALESFSSALTLDEIIVIPDFLPPHKEHDAVARAEDRLKMCELAFSHVRGAKVSDIEIKRGGKSYTYITLSELSGEDRELYLLVGTDMFLTLSKWVRSDIIFALATICLVRRESDAEITEKIKCKISEYTEQLGARVIEIPHTVHESSSTEARVIDFQSKDAEALIPEGVLEYINEVGLYK